ncbi:MAG TPA: nucleotidyltransferase domain-containing protein, partial [Phycisphaerales bacterium]|nr:nucleotidyltransferase domain-containing protein [Phycisphaerales bacterium]
YLPPAAAHWSIYGVPEQLENEATQEVYWELEKYLRLALKGNPNVLETLYTPLVEHADATAQRMLAMRSAFLSRLIYQTFNGYALSQMNKLEQDLRTKGKLKWKHAMHLLRLLIAGIGALRTGELPVAVTRDRDRLIGVRDGAEPWESVNAWRLALHAEFERAFSESRLPDRPDYEAANRLLLDARREMAAKERL